MYKTFALIIFILALMTFMRNNIWRTDIKLWTDNVKKSPAKTRPNVYLGAAFLRKEKWQQAELFFRRTLDINPDHLRAKYGLSEALFNMGRYEEALMYLKQIESAYLNLVKIGIEAKERGQMVYHNIAVCYYMLGNFKEAEIYFKKAIDMFPESINLVEGLIDLLFEQNRKEEAIFYIERFLTIAGNEYENRENLKNILKELKKGD